MEQKRIVVTVAHNVFDLGQSSNAIVTHRRAQILLSLSECAFDVIAVDQVINLIMPKNSENIFIN